MDIKGEHMNTG